MGSEPDGARHYEPKGETKIPDIPERGNAICLKKSPDLNYLTMLMLTRLGQNPTPSGHRITKLRILNSAMIFVALTYQMIHHSRLVTKQEIGERLRRTIQMYT